METWPALCLPFAPVVSLAVASDDVPLPQVAVVCGWSSGMFSTLFYDLSQSLEVSLFSRDTKKWSLDTISSLGDPPSDAGLRWRTRGLIPDSLLLTDMQAPLSSSLLSSVVLSVIPITPPEKQVTLRGVSLDVKKAALNKCHVDEY